MKLSLAAIGGAVLALLIGGSYITNHPPAPTPTATCYIRGVLPDPSCTPGSINPNVAQTNIHSTICLKGWTATIRPPQSYTKPLKIKSIRAYGYTDTKLVDYEFDHLIPLELGGNPTDVRNLWAEPHATPNPKDAIENHLRARVCSGQMLLAIAQQKIATDWTTALK